MDKLSEYGQSLGVEESLKFDQLLAFVKAMRLSKQASPESDKWRISLDNLRKVQDDRAKGYEFLKEVKESYRKEFEKFSVDELSKKYGQDLTQIDSSKFDQLLLFVEAKRWFQSSVSDRDNWVRLYTMLESTRMTVDEGQVAERIADITLGLDETLTHGADVDAACERINDLFAWFSDESQQKKYLAPYIPIIQSSGMGKTRLLFELKDVMQVKCVLVLCAHAHRTVKQEVRSNFDYVVSVYEGMKRENITSELKNIALKGKNCEKLVVLFDESQHLLTSKGYPFRCIRWWLREKRSNLKIVAAFAGTTSRLSNSYEDDEQEATDTRNPSGTEYWNGDSSRIGRVYEPFFMFHTIGLVNKDPDPHGSELATAALYGRPLFKVLQKTGELSIETDPTGKILKNRPMFWITLKMLLSRRNWQDDSKALYSILGTRVQLGVSNSVQLSTELVSNAYANLVSFSERENGKK